MAQAEPVQKYYSTKELADRYKCSTRTIARWTSSRGFPRPAMASRGYGSLWLIEDVVRWEVDTIERNSGAMEVGDY